MTENSEQTEQNLNSITDKEQKSNVPIKAIYRPQDLKQAGIQVQDFAYKPSDQRFLCDYPEIEVELEENEVVKVRALYDFHSEEEENALSFKENDIILITDIAGNGWLSGVLNGKEGYVPESFVERIE